MSYFPVAFLLAAIIVVLLGIGWNVCPIACMFTPIASSSSNAIGESTSAYLYAIADIGGEFQHIDLLAIAIAIVADQIGIISSHFHPDDLPIKVPDGKPLLGIDVTLKTGLYAMIVAAFMLDIICGYARSKILARIEAEAETSAVASTITAGALGGGRTEMISTDDEDERVPKESTPLIVSSV